MNTQKSNLPAIYRFSSIARPIDPAFLTNRALLIVLPLVMLLSAGLASTHDLGMAPVSAAFSGGLAAFAAWALTRELAPDYNDAAFLALGLAWIANIAFEARLVLLLFVALLLSRLVNRSTGLPLRPLDTLTVFGFCTWAAFNTQQPLILLIASLAFAFDAALKDPLRRHYLAAAACLAVCVWMLFDRTYLLADDLAARDWGLVGLFFGGIFLVTVTSANPVSYCDTSPDRLDRARVNAGLYVGFLVALQALLTNGRSAWLETPIWVSFFAVLFSYAIRFRRIR